jgi:hypothetical protein
MSLDDLEADVTAANADLADRSALDREARTELAMLVAALDGDADELLRRAVHLLFQTTVDSGRLDFHLRSEYGVTYDEYLSGMTYEEMTDTPAPDDDGDRHYQF